MDNLKNKIHIIKSLFYTSEYNNIMSEIIRNKEIVMQNNKINGCSDYFVFNNLKQEATIDSEIVIYLIGTEILQETGGCTYRDYFTITYQIDSDLTDILKNTLKDLTWSLPVQGDTVNIIRNGGIYDNKRVTNIIFEPSAIELYIVFNNIKTSEKLYFPIKNMDNKLFNITKMVLTEKFIPNNWTFKNGVV